MGILSSFTCRGRQAVAALLTALALCVMAPLEAFARQPLAVILVDARTGKVLYAKDADARRYPASITKVMTLYLLFRELKAGRMTLRTRLKVSRRASLKPPSKLWLKPGQTITVDQAIRALVVKSANDVAAVVAENLAGSESAFARRMTAMARALGMTRTVFRNASGLPNPPNVSTARDLATLSLRLMRDFPEYYRRYFGLRYFTWRGRRHRNHNRLLGRVRGMDGIKTGYTRAAGSNLAASVRRGGKRVVAVVLGAPSSRWRNAYMARLLNTAFRKYRLASGARIAPLAGHPPGYSVARARAWAMRVARTGTTSRQSRAERLPRRQNFTAGKRKPVVRTADVHVPSKAASRRLALLARMAATAPLKDEKQDRRARPVAAPVRPQPRPQSIVSHNARTAEQVRKRARRNTTKGPEENGVLVLTRTPARKLSASARVTAGAAGGRNGTGKAERIAALATAVKVRVPSARDGAPAATPAGRKTTAGAGTVLRERSLPDAPPVRMGSALPADDGVLVIPRQPPAAGIQPLAGAPRGHTAADSPSAGTRPGEEIIARRPDVARELMAARWLIQIGAFPTLEGARKYLEKARRATSRVHGRYPLVIRVHKGNAAFYRARYAGFTRKDAIRACQELRRKGISCLPMAPGAG